LLTAKSRKPGALRDAKVRRRPRDEVCGLESLTEVHSIGAGGVGVGPVHCHRVGGVREVGLMAVFLSSDAAAHVTGQPFVIDGGTSLV